jgi:hypothetical protein
MRRLLQFAALFLLAATPAAAMSLAHVSLPTNLHATSSPTSFTVTTSTGNLNEVYIYSDTAACTVSSVTDNKSQTYTVEKSLTGQGTTANLYLFIGFNLATGITTISVTHASTCNISIVDYDVSSTTGGQIDKTASNTLATSANPAPSLTSIASAGGFTTSFVMSESNNASAVSSPFTLELLSCTLTVYFSYSAYDANAGGGTLTSLPAVPHGRL